MRKLASLRMNFGRVRIAAYFAKLPELRRRERLRDPMTGGQRLLFMRSPATGPLDEDWGLASRELLRSQCPTAAALLREGPSTLTPKRRARRPPSQQLAS